MINKKIGLKLTVQIGMLVIFVSIALTFVSYFSTSKIMAESMNSKLQQDAINTVELFDKELDKQRIEIELLARTDIIKTMDWSKQEGYLSQETKYIDLLRMQVSDLNGQTRIPGGNAFDLSQKDNFKKVISSGETVVTPPLNSEADNKTIIIISTPIHDDNNSIIGVLGAVFDAEEFNNIVASQNTGKDGFAFIIDENGKIIAHKDVNLLKQGINLVDKYKDDKNHAGFISVINNMKAGKTGFSECYYDGESKYITYRAIPNTSWSLGIVASVSESIAQVQSLRNMMVMIALLFIVIGTIVSLLIARNIKEPLEEIIIFSKELSSGNLTYRLENKRKDELGQIIDALNQMANGISNLVRGVMKSTEIIKDTSESMVNITNESSKVSFEISSNMQEMSKVTTDQSMEIQNGSIAIEGLAKKIEDIYSNINEMNENSKITKNYNSDGIKAVKGLITKTEGTVAQVKKVHSIVLNMDESVKLIGMITNSISEISDQTNLLALNAAIESARAGEVGKGFAVVADEIRKLAEGSSKAANEIQQLITKIQGQSGEAVASMDETECIVNNQAESVDNVGENFSEISKLVNKIIKIITEVQTTNIVVNEEKDKIVDMISNISAISEENAASTQEVCAATEEQTASLDKIFEESNALNELAKKVKEDLNLFKI